MIVLWIVLWILVGLLALAGLIILIAFILITVKVRYKVIANIGDTTKADVKITYLLGLVGITLSYNDNEIKYVLRVAWLRFKGDFGEIDVKDVKVDKKREEKQRKKNVKIEKSLKKKKPIKSRAEPLMQVKAALTDPDTKIIIGLGFRALWKVVRALKPKKLSVVGIVGFEEPHVTGWVMGAYEALVGMLGLRQYVRLTGDFTQKALYLDIQARGGFRIIRFLWIGLWLYLHKKVRLFLRKYI